MPNTSSLSHYVTMDRTQPTPRTSMTSSPRHSPLNFELTSARGLRRPPSVLEPVAITCAANAIPAVALSVAYSHRSNRSRVSTHSVAVPSAVFDIVHRMTDALLEVTHQSRDDDVARERLLLQQQQLILRETNEREQRAVVEARAREKVLLEDVYKREQKLSQEEAMQRDKVTLEREKRMKRQVSIPTAATKQTTNSQLGTPASHSLTSACVRLKQVSRPQSQQLLLTHLYTRRQLTWLPSSCSRPVLNSNQVTWPFHNSGLIHLW